MLMECVIIFWYRDIVTDDPVNSELFSSGNKFKVMMLKQILFKIVTYLMFH